MSKDCLQKACILKQVASHFKVFSRKGKWKRSSFCGTFSSINLKDQHFCSTIHIFLKNSVMERSSSYKRPAFKVSDTNSLEGLFPQMKICPNQSSRSRNFDYSGSASFNAFTRKYYFGRVASCLYIGLEIEKCTYCIICYRRKNLILDESLLIDIFLLRIH